MCRHEPVARLRLLVLDGRRPLRPAPCCVRRMCAQVVSTVRRDSVQLDSRPGRSHTFRAFCVQGVCMTTKLFALLVLLLGFAAWPTNASAQPINGLWDATVAVNNGALEIPFRFEIAGSGSNVKGSFFNGDDQTTSTSGSFDR